MQDVTLLRYATQFEAFKSYCLNKRLGLHSISAVDNHMASYFADLFDNNEGYNAASYTLFGYLMLEADEDVADRFLLPRARAALKGWSSRFPQSSRAGADPALWFLIAAHFLQCCSRDAL